ncbi:cation-translocating P-type ATPase [Actinoplanes regularis]|uniref:Ca2+-transporting ATPase n=1 Tax=Actinoplanes regularis TaxID=52697 RepID=A0A239GXQ0_9ACTN|nr:cation-translocating P-type ATPase [Actinoplanes regularis]GIE90947.1 ATPase [Actinoplanes regularis]SNS73986.1 Ca2+-transporting ATPase [Actinoplanes regularis]
MTVRNLPAAPDASGITRPPARVGATHLATPDAGGLSSGDAAQRLARDGGNVLPSPRPTPLWRRIVTQLRDPLVLVLLAAAVFTLATADFTDASVILLVIVVNTTVGVLQEIKAERAITALSALTAPAARVIRDGRQGEVPAADLVVDDLLVLAEGDVVPADARLVESVALLVDEAALTGESAPVDKAATTDPAASTSNVVSAGTVVVRGRGHAVITATGTASALGRIAAMLVTAPALTPLQRRLAGVGRQLAVGALLLCIVVLALGLFRGQPLQLMIITAISLVVAAVPESLPAVVTLSLALGARRMTARNAVVRRLPAVETLGSVTILATDKTGTLTEGTMVVRQLWTAHGDASVSGSGFGPDGRISRDGNVVSPDQAPDLVELMRAAVLCGDASLRPPGADGDDWLAVGDPTEAALLTAGGKLGIDVDALHQATPREAEAPFDSERKRMSTAHRLPDGRVQIICKGAPESILDPAILNDHPDTLRRTADRADAFAAGGFRVLAVAQAQRDTVPADAAGYEHDLRLLGLVAILDPPRASAATTIAACHDAGIIPVLITGDHPATASAIAADLGVIAPGGEAVDCRTTDPAPAAARGVRVFARATPQQKVVIIDALRGAGEVVAMTGDGVNDGPALHRADIGVAMGRRGTEVARQAADLVLADDELGTVVAAAEEGRRVYANIRRFLLYALSGGAAEITVMLAGPFVGLALPLLPAQILWINLVTHGVPGLAMGSEPADPTAMHRPPRPPAETVLGAGLWQRILRVGAVIAAVTIGVGMWAHATDRPWQTLLFLALGLTQLAVALGSRARPGSRANPMLFAAVGAALLLQLAAIYTPLLRELLGTEPVAVTDLLIVAAVAALGYAAIRLDRRIHQSPRPYPNKPGHAVEEVPAR